MNRQQRRMQERKEKKKNRIPEQKFELNMSMIQPWSTFVMKTKLPDAILSKMLEITDKMVEDKPTIEEVLPLFAEFCGELPLVLWVMWSACTSGSSS